MKWTRKPMFKNDELKQNWIEWMRIIFVNRKLDTQTRKLGAHTTQEQRREEKKNDMFVGFSIRFHYLFSLHYSSLSLFFEHTHTHPPFRSLTRFMFFSFLSFSIFLFLVDLEPNHGYLLFWFRGGWILNTGIFVVVVHVFLSKVIHFY